MGNLSAVLFLLVACAVPLLSPTIRASRSLYLACLFSLVVRHAAAFINAFVTPLLTSWGDLYRFHNIGAGLDPEQGQPYGELLRLIYSIFGTSFWLGEECSVLVFSLSFVVFVELSKLLNVQEKLLGCLLVYGLLPANIIHFSVTMREAYQNLGLLVACYALFQLRLKQTPPAWALLLSSLVVLVYSHMGLALVALALLLFGIPWAIGGRGTIGAIFALVMLTSIPIIAPKMLSALDEQSSAAYAFKNGKLLEYATSYRNFIGEARSDYGVKISTDSLPEFVSTCLLVVFMYFMAPLPWQITNIMDFYAFFEVVLRLFLVYGFVQRILSSSGEYRHRLNFIFILTLGIELLWSIGTSNWGTAIRHHGVTFGLLVLGGLPAYPALHIDPESAALESRRARRLEDSKKTQKSIDRITIHWPRVWAAARKNAPRFCILTGICAAVTAWFTWPPISPSVNLRPVYSSSTTLLLASGRSLTSKMFFANTRGKSDLEQWLIDPYVFDQLLEREHFKEKLAARLQKKRPSLATYANSVSIVPVFPDLSRTLELYAKGYNENLDYAQIEGEEENLLLARRASRLKMVASAFAPEDSAVLLKEAITQVQEILSEVATRKIRAQRKVIEGYIRMGTRRLDRSEKRLSSSPQAEADWLEQSRRLEVQLNQETSRLRKEISEMQLQLDHIAQDAALTDASKREAMRNQLEALRLERTQAQEIYTPDSDVLQAIHANWERHQRFVQAEEARIVDRASSSLRPSLMAKQALLQQYQQELRTVRLRVPPTRQLTKFREKEREFLAWEQELLHWQQRLLEIRVEEQLCEGDGTATLLQPALPGTLNLQATANPLIAYKKLFSFLPLAPLLAFTLLSIGNLASKIQDVHDKVEFFCDAQILCELPALPYPGGSAQVAEVRSRRNSP